MSNTNNKIHVESKEHNNIKKINNNNRHSKLKHYMLHSLENLCNSFDCLTVASYICA